MSMEEKVYWYCRWMLRVVPIVLMAGHWWLVGHADGTGTAGGTAGTAVAVAAYVVPLVVVWPLSVLFGIGRIWRVPLAYLAAVDLAAVMHGTWALTEGMRAACTAAACVALGLYAWLAVAAAGKSA